MKIGTLITICISAIGANYPAWADSPTADLSVTMTAGSSTFKENKKSSTAALIAYDFEENKYALDEKFQGSEQNGLADEKQRSELNGYLGLKIARISEDTVSVQFKNLQVVVPDGLKNSGDFTATGKFTQGSWSEYIAGQSVQIELSSADTQSYFKKIADSMVSVIQGEVNTQVAGLGINEEVDFSITQTTGTGAVLSGTVVHMEHSFETAFTAQAVINQK